MKLSVMYVAVMQALTEIGRLKRAEWMREDWLSRQ